MSHFKFPKTWMSHFKFPKTWMSHFQVSQDLDESFQVSQDLDESFQVSQDLDEVWTSRSVRPARLPVGGSRKRQQRRLRMAVRPRPHACDQLNRPAELVPDEADHLKLVPDIDRSS